MSQDKANFDESDGPAAAVPNVMGGMNCPSDDILLMFHRTKLPRKKSREVAGHISQCNACGPKSAFIRNILRDENRLIQDIQALVPRKKKGLILGRRFLSFHPNLFTRRNGVAVAIVLILFIPLVLTFIPAHHPPSMKRNSFIMENIEMAYGSTPSTRLFSKWTGVPDSRYFIGGTPDSKEGARRSNANFESFSLFSPPGLLTRLENENDRLIISLISESGKAKSNYPEFTLRK